ncbi:ribosomal protein S8e/ribosomal biogenesis NSA2 [Nemania serpens]|nr:ribosomal protein S8e/ribosomal biogenesis NSA2 [Nemania serpens]
MGAMKYLHLVTLDCDKRVRKRLARDVHKRSEDTQNVRGFRANMMHEARRVEKTQMQKQIRALERSATRNRNAPDAVKALSSQIKQKRNEKAARFSVPLPKVRGISEEEVFQVLKTEKKTHRKAWKRMIAKPTFVAPGFTRQNHKFERFIRPMGLRQRTAHVSHSTLGVTVKLPIIGVELGIATAPGKVVWGRYAQITNNPENDGAVNS